MQRRRLCRLPAVRLTLLSVLDSPMLGSFSFLDCRQDGVTHFLAVLYRSSCGTDGGYLHHLAPNLLACREHSHQRSSHMGTGSRLPPTKRRCDAIRRHVLLGQHGCSDARFYAG